MKNEQFQKKIYTKLSSGSVGEILFPHSPQRDEKTPPKKIKSTPKPQSMREEFKKTFLPLLIDVFELRQMIENHKMHRQKPFQFPIDKISKTPHEILEQLHLLQAEIEESQKWCKGVILQISKGIAEAKETLEYLENPQPEKKKAPLVKKILSWIKR
jgi:16S rRNA C967 or C1407 C5-methylase (RsmB/RsmF family)